MVLLSIVDTSKDVHDELIFFLPTSINTLSGKRRSPPAEHEIEENAKQIGDMQGETQMTLFFFFFFFAHATPVSCQTLKTAWLSISCYRY